MKYMQYILLAIVLLALFSCTEYDFENPCDSKYLLEPVTNLNATVPDEGLMVLNWSYSGPVTSFRIDRKTDIGNWNECFSSVSGQQCTYSDTQITLNQTYSYRVIVCNDLNCSNAAEVTKQYSLVVATPVMSPSGGTYNDDQIVTITCDTSEASIRYTTDGSEPTESSSIYSSPISISSTTTLKAKGFRTGWNNSETATASYSISISTVATPTFNPPGGSYTSSQSVTISCTTNESTIRYTTDGSEPTESSSIYSSPISISSTSTLKARAYYSDWTPSSITSAQYNIVPMITITYPNGGEVLYIGNTYTIQWDTADTTILVDILYYKGEQLWGAIHNYYENTGSIQWSVPLALSGQTGSDFRICIRNSDVIGYPDQFDYSDSYFTISE